MCDNYVAKTLHEYLCEVTGSAREVTIVTPTAGMFKMPSFSWTPPVAIATFGNELPRELAGAPTDSLEKMDAKNIAALSSRRIPTSSLASLRLQRGSSCCRKSSESNAMAHRFLAPTGGQSSRCFRRRGSMRLRNSSFKDPVCFAALLSSLQTIRIHLSSINPCRTSMKEVRSCPMTLQICLLEKRIAFSIFTPLRR